MILTPRDGKSPASESPGAPPSAATGRVWLVDDSALELETTRALLATRYVVTTFTNGEDLLERLSQDPIPDLLILDGELPGISGTEICEFVRRRHDAFALPVIMLTGNARPEHVDAGYAVGANDYVTKPVRGTELLARVATLVRMRQREQEVIASRASADVSRARLSALFENAPAFVCTLRGPTHVFEMVNPLFQRLIGQGRTLVGLSVRDAVPEVVAQGFIGLLDRVYETGTPFHGTETPILLDRAADGRLEDAFLNFVYQPSRDAAGRVDGIDVFGFDVTEHVRARQRAEELTERVRTSEETLRLVMDSIPLLVSFVTDDERYGLVNKAYEEWFGQPRDALKDRKVRDVVGEAAWATLSPFVRRGLAGERFDFQQYAVPYRFGGTRDVKVSFVPHRAASGNVDGYVALLEDITDRRRLEQDRETALGRLSDLIESMSDAFIALDAGWRIVVVNRDFERITGLRRESLVGKIFWDAFPADPSATQWREYHLCMAERVPVQFVVALGGERFIDVRANPTSDGGIAVIYRDVSADKRAQLAAKRQSEFEQQLIGIVSHDVRNPLNVIYLASNLLMRMHDLGEDATRLVIRVRNAAERATRLVRDLLDFTQGRLGGGIRVHPRATDLHRIVRPVIDEIEAAYPNRTIEVDEKPGLDGSWDGERLGQVLQNLVTNALKYSPNDSRVRVVTRGDGDGVVLRVHNHGAPIAPEKLSVLFEPFERGSQVDSATRSVGLGLYIVKQIVQAHHGTVDVRSTAAAGTTVSVRLPRAPPAPDV